MAKKNINMSPTEMFIERIMKDMNIHQLIILMYLTIRKNDVIQTRILEEIEKRINKGLI